MEESHLHALLKKCIGTFINFSLRNGIGKTKERPNPYFKEVKRNGLKSS